MSHTTSLDRSTASHLLLRYAGPIVGLVFAASAAAVLSIWVTLSWMDPGPVGVAPKHAVLQSPRVDKASPGTGVPDASAVFKDSADPIEEPTPTF